MEKMFVPIQHLSYESKNAPQNSVHYERKMKTLTVKKKIVEKNTEC